MCSIVLLARHLQLALDAARAWVAESIRQGLSHALQADGAKGLLQTLRAKLLGGKELLGEMAVFIGDTKTRTVAPAAVLACSAVAVQGESYLALNTHEGAEGKSNMLIHGGLDKVTCALLLLAPHVYDVTVAMAEQHEAGIGSNMPLEERLLKLSSARRGVCHVRQCFPEGAYRESIDKLALDLEREIKGAILLAKERHAERYKAAAIELCSTAPQNLITIRDSIPAALTRPECQKLFSVVAAPSTRQALIKFEAVEKLCADWDAAQEDGTTLERAPEHARIKHAFDLVSVMGALWRSLQQGETRKQIVKHATLKVGVSTLPAAFQEQVRRALTGLPLFD